MALTPFTPRPIANVQSGSALVENWGRATAYFQRYLQDMLANIQGQFSDLAAIIAEIEAQQIEIEAAQADAAAAQATADAAYTYATVTLQNEINTERNRVNSLYLMSPNIGVSTQTPTSGYINISHGQPFTPDLGDCVAVQAGILPVVVSIVSVNSSVLSVYVQDFTGTAYTAGAVSIAWQVSGY